MLREWLQWMTKVEVAHPRLRCYRRGTFHGRVERLESRMVLSASIGAYAPPLETAQVSAAEVGDSAMVEIESSSSYRPEFRHDLREPHWGGPSPLAAFGAAGNFGPPAPSWPMMPPKAFGGELGYRPPIYALIIFIEMPAPNMPAPSVGSSYSPPASQPEVSLAPGYSREPQFAKAGPSAAADDPSPQTSFQSPWPTRAPTSLAPQSPANVRVPASAASALVAPLVSVSASTVENLSLDTTATLETAFQQMLKEASDADLLLLAGNSDRLNGSEFGFEIDWTETERPRDGSVNSDDLSSLDDNTLANRALQRQRDAIDEVLMRLHELPRVNADQFNVAATNVQRKSLKPSPAEADAVFAGEAPSQPIANPTGEEGGMVWLRSTADPTGMDYLSAGIQQVDLTDWLEATLRTKTSLGIHQAFDVAGPEEDSIPVAPPAEVSTAADAASRVTTEDQSPPARNAATWLGLATLFSAISYPTLNKRRAQKPLSR